MAGASGAAAPGCIIFCSTFVERVEDYEIVVLLLVFFEAVVLRKEGQEFFRGPVVPELGGPQTFMFQHCLEDLKSYSAALATLMHVEVERADGAHLAQHLLRTRARPLRELRRGRDEEVFLPDLEEAQRLRALRGQVDALTHQAECAVCNRLPQPLGCSGALAQGVKDGAQAFTMHATEHVLLETSDILTNMSTWRTYDRGKAEGKLHGAQRVSVPHEAGLATPSLRMASA